MNNHGQKQSCLKSWFFLSLEIIIHLICSYEQMDSSFYSKVMKSVAINFATWVLIWMNWPLEANVQCSNIQKFWLTNNIFVILCPLRQETFWHWNFGTNTFWPCWNGKWTIGRSAMDITTQGRYSTWIFQHGDIVAPYN